MTDSVTEQIERAWDAFLLAKRGCLPDMHGDDFRTIARDLLAGKFKEAPLPEIHKPVWAERVWVDGRAGSLFNVTAQADGVKVGGTLMGQCQKTAREAIECWNELFTRKDER